MVDLIVFCSVVNIVVIGLSYCICKPGFGSTLTGVAHAI